MHEFSICEGLVNAVLSELEKLSARPLRLKKVRVAIGGMRQIVPDTLLFAYQSLIRDTPAAGSELELRPVPITAKCKACGWQGEIEHHLFLCQECDTSDLDILTGAELYLENLEIEEDE